MRLREPGSMPRDYRAAATSSITGHAYTTERHAVRSDASPAAPRHRIRPCQRRHARNAARALPYIIDQRAKFRGHYAGISRHIITTSATICFRPANTRRKKIIISPQENIITSRQMQEYYRHAPRRLTLRAPAYRHAQHTR